MVYNVLCQVISIHPQLKNGLKNFKLWSLTQVFFEIRFVKLGNQVKNIPPLPTQLTKKCKQLQFISVMSVLVAVDVQVVSSSNANKQENHSRDRCADCSNTQMQLGCTKNRISKGLKLLTINLRKLSHAFQKQISTSIA